MADLVKYEAAKVAIAEAKAVDEIKLIRDNASAIKAAARVANDKQLEVDASEIRIRAERRLGEMIRHQKETVGLNKGGRPKKTPTTAGGVSPSLEDVGVDYNLSSRSQAIAAIPEDEFEETLAEHRESQQAVTARTMESLAKKGKEARDPLDTIQEVEDQSITGDESVVLFHLKRYWKQANRKDKNTFMEWIDEN